MSSFNAVARSVWDSIEDGVPWRGDANRLHLTGPRVTFPSDFDVTGLAVGAVSGAYLAAAQLLAARRGLVDVPEARVDSRAASAAFQSERRFTPIGWELPSIWDSIAGNYRSADGWILLHTNYPHHRAAVESLLNAKDRSSVQRQVARTTAEELESAIVAAGGAAAALHTRTEWLASGAAVASAHSPAVTTSWRKAKTELACPTDPTLPFSGIRVLDLTRVIAGPVCTSFLAGYGADVLRIDPPGFQDVAALLPVTTMGKRSAALDLSTSAGRAQFEALVAEADVLLCGLRADALDRLGFSDNQLLSVNADLVVARLNAYGWSGAWRNRRGYDSLVQFSSGIAATGYENRDAPNPLPAQALDHATGWLLAAAISRVLARRLQGDTATIRASLIDTANLLYYLPLPSEAPSPSSVDELPRTARSTAWGPVQGVGPAGSIRDVSPYWREAGPLGRHEPSWLPRRR